MCQISVDPQYKEVHLGGGFHRARAAQVNKVVVEVMQLPKPIQKLWTCKICKAVVAETEMANHLLGEQHAKVIIANLEAARSWQVLGVALNSVQISVPASGPVVGEESSEFEVKSGDEKKGGEGSEKPVFGFEDDEFYGLVP